MITIDQADFGEIMINCFENYGKIPSKSIIEMWFDALKSFNFVHVRNAFTSYLRENDKRKGAPAVADILKLAKKSAASAYVQLRETRTKRCYVDGCNSPEDQIAACDYRPDIFICRHHLDEFVLTTMPNSNHARVIREDKEFRTEAARLGRTLREHIEVVLDERILKGIEITRKEGNQRVILKEDMEKSAEEYLRNLKNSGEKIFSESMLKPIANSKEILDYDIPF